MPPHMKNRIALLILTSFIAMAFVRAGERGATARQEVRNLLTKARLEVMIDHFKHLNAERLKVELDLQFARAEAGHADGAAADSARLAALERRLGVLQRAIEEREHTIERLFVERADDGPAKPKSAPPVVEWHGRAVDDSGLELVVWLSGDEGKFVVEAEANRLAGHVTIRGGQCDFRVVEARGDEVEKFLGRTALGICRMTDRGLAIVLNEPGKPDRPTKLEADGDFKGFLLERR